MFTPRLKEQLLQRLVEFPNRLVFANSDIALKPLHIYICSDRHGIRELGFAAPWGAFNQERFLHASGEIHHRKRYGVDDVSCGAQLGREFSWGREHVGSPLGLNTTPELICSHA